MQETLSTLGKVWAITKADTPVQVHKFIAKWDDRLRVKWAPLFYGQNGEETTEVGGKPSLEAIAIKQVLAEVQLHDGVLGHAVARRLDKAGWKVAEASTTAPAKVQVVEQSVGLARSIAKATPTPSSKRIDLLEFFGAADGVGKELLKWGSL